MRELSQQLVATQEEERKNLSRELHDHVGQVLTALRMELGRIERLRAPGDAPIARRGRREPAARRQHGPHGARPRARPASEHARRLRPAAGARVARARLQPPVRPRRRPGTISGDLERAARTPSHLRLPRRAGGADQLRAPRRAAHDRRVVIAGGDDRVDRSVTTTASGIDPQRPRDRAGTARDRGTGAGSWAARWTSGARPDAERRLAIQLPAAAITRPGGGRLRVLLADDHGIVRRGLRSLLERRTRADGGRRSRRRPRGAAALRGAPARRADPRHRRCRS